MCAPKDIEKYVNGSITEGAWTGSVHVSINSGVDKADGVNLTDALLTFISITSKERRQKECILWFLSY